MSKGFDWKLDQPAPGLNISFMAGNPSNAPPRQASRHPSNCQAVEKKEGGREGGASQLGNHSTRRLTRFLMNATTRRREPCAQAKPADLKCSQMINMPETVFIANFHELNLNALKQLNSHWTFFSFVRCTNTAAVASGENHILAVK